MKEQISKNKAEITKDPHLIDWGNVQEVAQYIGMFLLGSLGKVAYDVTKDVAYDITKDKVREILVSIKRRFGKSKVRQVKTNVIELIQEAKEESSLSDEEIAARVEEVFKDFQ
ncbi:MAG: hypothetical protein PVI90_07015 [Desulfobacteraceae bacterium]|jgi:hypothetical protein